MTALSGSAAPSRRQYRAQDKNKKALRDRFWLRDSDGPVVAYVGRLDEQKGMHLVHHALFYTLARRGQFVLIGDAHYHDGITSHFWHLKDYLNERPGLPPGDGVPRGPGSSGLRGRGPARGAQHVRAVRAGSAHRHAVRDGARGAGDRRNGRHRVDQDHSRRPAAERNGYVFHHTDNQAIESALGRALRLWSARPREFGRLAASCMRADYSWARPGQEYLDIYQLIRHK